MKAYTDYPFEELGDIAYKGAPVREVKILSYDNDKYCEIEVEGILTEVKSGYLYKSPGRYGEVPFVEVKDLEMLK